MGSNVCTNGNCESGSEQSCSSGSCGSGSCQSSGCGKSSGCEMTDMMMGLSHKAWMCLMKDKMKAELEKHRGEQMNKMAAAIVEASIASWEHKMQGKMQCHEHKEKIKQAMMG